MGRRRETTDYLKGCIADSLIELMRRKPISKITAQEIADLANTGRVTYFRHFQSYEDVLEYKLLCLWENWAEAHPAPENNSVDEYTLWFFSFCASITDILRLLCEQSQYMCMINAFLLFTSPAMEKAQTAGRYKQIFFAYGIHGIVVEWIRNGCRETPEDFARMSLE